MTYNVRNIVIALVLAAVADLVGFADLASLAMVAVGAAGAGVEAPWNNHR